VRVRVRVYRCTYNILPYEFNSIYRPRKYELAIVKKAFYFITLYNRLYKASLFSFSTY